MSEPRVIEHDPVASSEAYQRVLTPEQQDKRAQQRRLDKIETGRKRGVPPISGGLMAILASLARCLRDDEPMPVSVTVQDFGKSNEDPKIRIKLGEMVQPTADFLQTSGMMRLSVPAEIRALTSELVDAETTSEFAPTLLAEAKRRGLL